MDFSYHKIGVPADPTTNFTTYTEDTSITGAEMRELAVAYTILQGSDESLKEKATETIRNFTERHQDVFFGVYRDGDTDGGGRLVSEHRPNSSNSFVA